VTANVLRITSLIGGFLKQATLPCERALPGFLASHAHSSTSSSRSTAGEGDHAKGGNRKRKKKKGRREYERKVG